MDDARSLVALNRSSPTSRVIPKRGSEQARDERVGFLALAIMRRNTGL